MRVSICVAELVMNSVVSAPSVNGILRSHAVGQHQEEAQGEASFVGTMGP